MSLKTVGAVLTLLAFLSACAGPRDRRPKAPPKRPAATVMSVPPPASPASPAPASAPDYMPPPDPYSDSISTYPRTAEEGSGPAALSLIRQAQVEREAGRPDQALAALERALRIEPRNPFVWQALAALHVEQQRPELAESTAQKSSSLARGNPYVEDENRRLIAEARKQRGLN